MLRRIIKINEDLCNGCGLCAAACHEGAIGMVDGKATLLRDDYCDGLGDCLPVCPTGAIAFEEREALAYDDEAVKANMAKAKQQAAAPAQGCPGSRAMSIHRQEAAPQGCPGSNVRSIAREAQAGAPAGAVQSHLTQWPVQIKLAPVNAPWLQNAHLLVAADCTAFAYGNFHNDFIRNKVTLIGCPKLDEGDYAEKLTAILSASSVKSLTVARMQVPCCGGIERAAKVALLASGKNIPLRVVTISTDGTIVGDELSMPGQE